MKHTHKEALYVRPSRLAEQLFDEQSIFFDIETTGFSPKHSSIYMIGCARRKGEQILSDQFFAETPEQESEIVNAFLSLLKDYTTIVSFNGVGFDIPFLKAKCDSFHMNIDFTTFHYIDIFKSVSQLKFLLKLPNYKQKTIEEFLGLSRNDRFSGGELINVYTEYVKKPDEEKEELLYLHNYEDVMGLTELLPVLSYLEVFHGQYSITETQMGTFPTLDGSEEKEFFISLRNDFSVPKRVSYQYHNFYLTMKDRTTTLRIPVYSGELHFFYNNYKDYYYLPQEDMAVHKSVASFVEKGYRENARASNCYNRKSGDFLPQYDVVMHPEFRDGYKDKISYFEITEDFSTSDVMLRRYVDHILKLMLQGEKRTSPSKYPMRKNLNLE